MISHQPVLPERPGSIQIFLGLIEVSFPEVYPAERIPKGGDTGGVIEVFDLQRREFYVPRSFFLLADCFFSVFQRHG